MRARLRSGRRPRALHRARRRPRRIVPTTPPGRVAIARRVGARTRAACCWRRDGGGERGRPCLRGAAPRPPARRPSRSRALVGQAEIGRRLPAGLERLTPANVGELHLFERDAGISGHDAPFAAGVTVRRWSAIWRGAGVGAIGDAGASVEDELDSATIRATGRARGRGRDRTGGLAMFARRGRRQPSGLYPGPHGRGCSFNSSLTSATVSHGSSPDVGGLELGSAIQSLRRRRITISKFVTFDNT